MHEVVAGEQENHLAERLVAPFRVVHDAREVGGGGPSEEAEVRWRRVAKSPSAVATSMSP